MSKRLFLIIKFEKEISIENISEVCFDIVLEACKRKIAINQLHYDSFIDYFWFKKM